MRRKIKGKRKWPYIIAITVVTALCITTATEWSMVLTQPMQIQNDNQVSGNLTTSFSYQPIESPNPLLPKGGATTGNGTIFTAITRQLVIHEQMNFLANQPMTLHLSSTPIIRLIAPNMWEKITQWHPPKPSLLMKKVGLYGMKPTPSTSLPSMSLQAT